MEFGYTHSTTNSGIMCEMWKNSTKISVKSLKSSGKVFFLIIHDIFYNWGSSFQKILRKFPGFQAITSIKLHFLMLF